MYSKSDIIDCQAWAAGKGGKCLEIVYQGVHPLMSWECALGHTWKNTWGHVRKGQWCPTCAGKSKPDISECHDWAASKGGKCLEAVYVSNKTKMLWECLEGHRWKTTWHNVKNANSWCPICANNIRLTIEQCQEFIKDKHNGKCLETVYVTAHTKMSWECSEGHKWKTTWNSVSRGKWCAICAKNVQPTIEECQEFVKQEHSGECLDTVYNNNHFRMLWKCEKGHQWRARWNGIHRGGWCPTCAGKSKPDITELQNYAKTQHNGKCLEAVYVNNNTPVLWECEAGHQWKAMWTNVRYGGKWCPECSSFKTEYKCKELLERKLGFEFKKTNFKCGAHCYQWDGYNEEHKVAFEYNGEQHYVFPNYFHKTLKIHEAAKQRDIEKVQYAKENDIKLIIIPYTEEKNLESYIENLEFPNP